MKKFGFVAFMHQILIILLVKELISSKNSLPYPNVKIVWSLVILIMILKDPKPLE
jgi:hypothetical protein